MMIGSSSQLQLPYISLNVLGWAGGLITFLWITSLTNAYNFMDGIDGIAAGQAVVAGAAWAALGFYLDKPLVGSLGALVAGSSLAFCATIGLRQAFSWETSAVLSWVILLDATLHCEQG